MMHERIYCRETGRGETAERIEAGGRTHQGRVVYLVLTEGIFLQQVLVTATHLRRTDR